MFLASGRVSLNKSLHGAKSFLASPVVYTPSCPIQEASDGLSRTREKQERSPANAEHRRVGTTRCKAGLQSTLSYARDRRTYIWVTNSWWQSRIELLAIAPRMTSQICSCTVLGYTERAPEHDYYFYLLPDRHIFTLSSGCYVRETMKVLVLGLTIQLLCQGPRSRPLVGFSLSQLFHGSKTSPCHRQRISNLSYPAH